MSQPWHQPVRGHFKPIRGLGIAASVLIGLSVLTSIASAWSDWFTLGVVADYLNGVPGTTDADLAAADSIALATAGPDTLLLVAAGVVFVVWMFRARHNSEVLYGKAGHRRGSVWAFWGWIVPVVSWWFPYQVLQDVYRPSTRLSGIEVRWWWAAMVAKLWLGQLLTRLYLGDEITEENLRNIASVSTVTAALGVVAAFLIIGIIKRVGEGQLTPVETQVPLLEGKTTPG